MWTKKNTVIFTPTGDTTSQAIRKISNEIEEIYKYINRLFNKDASDLPPDDKDLHSLWYDTFYNRIRAFDGSDWKYLGLNGGIGKSIVDTYSISTDSLASVSKKLFLGAELFEWHETHFSLYGVYIGKFGYDLRPEKQIALHCDDMVDYRILLYGYLDSLYVVFFSHDDPNDYHILKVLRFDKNLNLDKAIKVYIDRHRYFILNSLVVTKKGVYIGIVDENHEHAYGILKLDHNLNIKKSVFYEDTVLDDRFVLLHDSLNNIYMSFSEGAGGDVRFQLLVKYDSDLNFITSKKVDSYLSDSGAYWATRLTGLSDYMGEDELYFVGWTRDHADQTIRIPLLLKTDQQLNNLGSWKLDREFNAIREKFFIGKGIIAEMKNGNFINAIEIDPPLGNINTSMGGWIYLAGYTHSNPASDGWLEFISNRLPQIQISDDDSGGMFGDVNTIFKTTKTTISREEYNLDYYDYDFDKDLYEPVLETEGYDPEVEEIEFDWDLYYG